MSETKPAQNGALPLSRRRFLGALGALIVAECPLLATDARARSTRPPQARFTRVVIDPTVQTGGDYHKAHVLGRFSHDPYLDAGAETEQGFTLYRYSEGWKPYVIFHDDSGPEDAHAADIDGDGWNDIVMGGWSNRLLWAKNPAGSGKDPYTTQWEIHTVATDRWCHDTLPIDIDHDGKCDIVTNEGIYFQGANPDAWTFKDIGRGSSVLGTAAGNMLRNRDGFNDVIGVNQVNGRNQICWFENPGHTGGNPRTGDWRIHVVDEMPGAAANVNCNEMSIAVGDIAGNGRLDIVAACQGEGPDNKTSQIGGGLVWYRAPADPRNGIWTKLVIDPRLGYVHTSSLQLADFTGSGRLDICFAQQEQSGPTPSNPKSGEPAGDPRQQVGIYYNLGGGKQWLAQILTQYPDPAAGGFNSKIGRIGTDKLPSILTANHGAFGQPNPVVLFRNLSR